MSTDFANVSDGRLLVYGWVLGLAKRVMRAEVRYGDLIVDLMSFGVPVPRSDVAKHFPGQVDVGDDAHGFYLTVSLPSAAHRPPVLRLSVWPKSGSPTESTWPVSTGESAVALFFQQHRATLDLLLKALRPSDAHKLRALASPEVERSAAGSVPHLPFGIDSCHLLHERTIVVLGWMEAGEAALTTARFTVGDEIIDCLPNLKMAVPRGNDALVNLRGETRRVMVFSWVGLVSEKAVNGVVASMAFATNAGEAVEGFTISKNAHVRFTHSLRSMDAEQAIDLLERISALVCAENAGLPAWLQDAYDLAIEQLPQVLEIASPHVFLHCEGAAHVPPSGIFLTGWCSAGKGAMSQISCRNGVESARLDGVWIRSGRPDVAQHLKSVGVERADEEHGFLCHVPFSHATSATYLSVTFSDGKVRRMRLPRIQSTSSSLHSIRAVLGSFGLPHRSLRALLDRQIGPAVQAAWAHRQARPNPTATQVYGASPGNPLVSVMVPLYGRFDLAEFQMALFADDADFKTAELIYFVDDPSIYDAFQAQCADLYGIYQVPFTLAFAGANLGFAGANNCAAAIATGEHLVLLNSDVLPKTPGWLSQMLADYRALEAPGLLGVKLLYEDGSVQHAGMTFRRHPAWADMWINEHPHKGQNAAGLSGVRQSDAVTAACAMVSATVYRELGGLSEDYIIGDFEDSDFCLRAAAAGRRNYVALDIELYHLERRSQALIGDSLWRNNLTLYNCWLHDKRWAAQIGKMLR